MKSITLLAIDTSTEACSAALLQQEKIKERYELAPRKHTQLILPMMQSLLDEAGLKLRDLDALAFTCGPGSFTGLRIAASILQASALAADLPVVCVSSLQCLAQGAYRELQAQQVFAAMDARLQEVFCAAYRLDEASGIMQACGPEQLLEAQQCVLTEMTDFVGVGSGWDLHHALFTAQFKNQLQRWVPQRYPRAYDTAVIASHAYHRGAGVSAAEALPNYLRETVAVRRGSNG
jgi:tRNA threonylcarbamoyladenosine biosynthesis protein TsaB